MGGPRTRRELAGSPPPRRWCCEGHPFMADAIVIRIEPSLVQVKPGAQISANITIRNRTEEVGHYLLNVEGLPAGWAEIVPDQVSAFPMQDIPSKLNIHPPVGTRGATYHAAVRATSQENANLEVRG